MLLALFALHCFGLMSVSQARTNANKPGQPNNPGNSARYCCVPEIYNDPASQCDNAVSCPGGPLTIDRLTVNEPHTTIFAFAFVFLGLDVAVMVFVYVITMWDSPALDPVRRQIPSSVLPIQKQIESAPKRQAIGKQQQLLRFDDAPVIQRTSSDVRKDE